jgi:hypothetical protein
LREMWKVLKAMNPVVKCSSCKQIMTERHFSKHTCEPKHKATKIIPAAEIIDLSEQEGTKKLLITGWDGVDYFFEVQKPLAIPFISTSNRKVTERYEDDENNQRGNRTHLPALYKGRRGLFELFVSWGVHVKIRLFCRNLSGWLFDFWMRGWLLLESARANSVKSKYHKPTTKLHVIKRNHSGHCRFYWGSCDYRGW